jgi:hypothetical protein
MVGDANMSSGSDLPDLPTIGDISVMIDAKFITSDCVGPDPQTPIIACLDEADVNGSGLSHGATCDDITIGDVSLLIDYLFITGPGSEGGCEFWGDYGTFPSGECKLMPCPGYPISPGKSKETSVNARE